MRKHFSAKVLIVSNLEKILAGSAAVILAVSVTQSMSTVSFNDSETQNDSQEFKTIAIDEYRAEAKSITSGLVVTEDTDTSVKVTTSSAKKSKKIKSTGTKSKIKKTVENKRKTGGSTENLLNSVNLKPDEFLSGRNDKIIKKYLKKLTSDNMSNYQKAKACYDYIIKNTYYSYGGWGNAVESVLENGFGTCTEYSYAYMAMLRYLGFNAKTVDGMTALAAGGYGYHMWVEVKINGTPYVFDPQVEDNMTCGEIKYLRFAKTYGEVSDSYIK